MKQKEHELQLNKNYTAFVTFTSYINKDYKKCNITLDSVVLVDLATEEVFNLNQVLPPLRYKLDYLIQEKSEKYIMNNFDEILREDDDYLIHLDPEVCYSFEEKLTLKSIQFIEPA